MTARLVPLVGSFVIGVLLVAGAWGITARGSKDDEAGRYVEYEVTLVRSLPPSANPRQEGESCSFETERWTSVVFRNPDGRYDTDLTPDAGTLQRRADHGWQCVVTLTVSLTESPFHVLHVNGVYQWVVSAAQLESPGFTVPWPDAPS